MPSVRGATSSAAWATGRKSKDWLFLTRIQVGLYSVLGALRATGDWRSVRDDLMNDAPPQTDLGRQHQEWAAPGVGGRSAVSPAARFAGSPSTRVGSIVVGQCSAKCSGEESAVSRVSHNTVGTVCSHGPRLRQGPGGHHVSVTFSHDDRRLVRRSDMLPGWTTTVAGACAPARGASRTRRPRMRRWS